MKSKIERLKPYAIRGLRRLTDFRFVIAVYIVAALISCILKYFMSECDPGVYPIYRQAFFNLIQMKDLYLKYPDIDYFLYTPTFPILIAPFAVLPMGLGAVLWGIANIIPFIIAIKLLPLSEFRKVLVAWLVFMPVLNNLQHFQSNVIVCALILLAFASFENKKPLWAALCLALGFFIKVYVIGFAVIFLFYPLKIRFLIYLALSFAAFLVLPLLIMPYDHFLFLYERWFDALRLDTSSNINFMGILKGWFNIYIHEVHIQMYSLLYLILPLFLFFRYKERKFRLLYVALLLIWVVIFSHKAESPSYVIAVTGTALWFTAQDEFRMRNIALIIFMFLFTCLSSTDIFPRIFRKFFITPYGIKAVPCIVIFFVCAYQLLNFTIKKKQEMKELYNA